MNAIRVLGQKLPVNKKGLTTWKMLGRIVYIVFFIFVFGKMLGCKKVVGDRALEGNMTLDRPWTQLPTYIPTSP